MPDLAAAPLRCPPPRLGAGARRFLAAAVAAAAAVAVTVTLSGFGQHPQPGAKLVAPATQPAVSVAQLWPRSDDPVRLFASPVGPARDFPQAVAAASSEPRPARAVTAARLCADCGPRHHRVAVLPPPRPMPAETITMAAAESPAPAPATETRILGLAIPDRLLPTPAGVRRVFAAVGDVIRAPFE